MESGESFIGVSMFLDGLFLDLEYAKKINFLVPYPLLCVNLFFCLISIWKLGIIEKKVYFKVNLYRSQ